MSNQPQPQSNSLTRQTISGMLWTASSTWVLALVKIGVVAVLARLLTPDDFGMLAAASVVISFTDGISGLGIATATVQRKNLEERHIRTGFTFSFFGGWITAGCLWLIAPLVETFFRIDGLSLVFRVLMLSIPIGAISTIAEALLQKELRFRTMTIIQITSYLAGFMPVALILSVLDYGVWALIWASLAKTLITSVMTLAARRHSLKFQFERRAFQELIYFGGGQTLSGILNDFALNGDYLVIGRFLGAGALGIYERAYNLMTLPLRYFVRGMDKVLFPAMSTIQDQPTRLAMAYRRSFSIMSFVILPVSVVTIILAPEIIIVLLGQNWLQAIIPFQILSLSMYFRSTSRINGSIAQAVGAVYGIAFRQALYAIMVIIGAIIGQNWGIAGASIGVAIAIILTFLLMTQLALKHIPFGWSDLWRAHVLAIRLSIMVGLAVWGCTSALRGLNLHPVLILLSSVVVAGGVLLITIHILPNLILGQDERQLVHSLAGYLPKNLRVTRWLRTSMENI